MRPPMIVLNLGKRYKRKYGAVTFHEAVLSFWRAKQSIKKFWALQDISFTVMPGEMLGVIGKNGSGKSTLLSLLGGCVLPDTGTVSVSGRIGSLLEPHGALHPELTGRDNLMVAAIVAGLTRAQILQRFDQIVEFAELQAVIDEPVRHYSFGMRMRLAFSIAVHNDANILLIDEHLSVGDEQFQQMCLRRITELRNQGCAIVLVSHNLDHVESHCGKALYLAQGLAVEYGDPGAVIERYKFDSEQPQLLLPKDSRPVAV
jgi:lipopolysaccharide transport system ATP-binding protein